MLSGTTMSGFTSFGLGGMAAAGSQRGSGLGSTTGRGRGGFVSPGSKQEAFKTFVVGGGKGTGRGRGRGKTSRPTRVKGKGKGKGRKAGKTALDADGDIAMDGGGASAIPSRADTSGAGKSKSKKKGKKVKRDMSSKISKIKGIAAAKGKGPSGGKGKPLSTEQLKTLEEAMAPRWNAAAQLLDLQGFVNDPLLASAGITMEWSNQMYCNAVAKIISAHCTNMAALDLSSNKISSLHPLAKIAQASKGIVRLNLMSNSLKNFGEIGAFKCMEKLEEIHLTGNAGLSKSQSDRVEYEKKLRNWFPKLKIIDAEPISSILPVSILGNAIPPEVDALVKEFVAKFYGAFDQARHNLLQAYTENSVWSLTLEQDLNRMPERYKGMNRNLRSKTLRQNADKAFDRLYCGQDILATLQTFPDTDHDMDLQVDVWMVTPTAIGINVSGKCTERKPLNQAISSKKAVPTEVRHVHRTLILAPAEQGSVAATAGWPCTIANEQVHISRYSKGKNESRLLASAVSAATSSTATSVTPSVTPDQQQMVMQLMQVTRMNQQYALDCLQTNAWNAENALGMFQSMNAAGQLPPNAFQ